MKKVIPYSIAISIMAPILTRALIYFFHHLNWLFGEYRSFLSYFPFLLETAICIPLLVVSFIFFVQQKNKGIVSKKASLFLLIAAFVFFVASAIHCVRVIDDYFKDLEMASWLAEYDIKYSAWFYTGYFIYFAVSGIVPLVFSLNVFVSSITNKDPTSNDAESSKIAPDFAIGIIIAFTTTAFLYLIELSDAVCYYGKYFGNIDYLESTLLATEVLIIIEEIVLIVLSFIFKKKGNRVFTVYVGIASFATAFNILGFGIINYWVWDYIEAIDVFTVLLAIAVTCGILVFKKKEKILVEEPIEETTTVYEEIINEKKITPEKIKQIKKIKALYDDGVLTEEEFNSARTRILDSDI